MSTPQINVHVQSGTGEILRIIATILLFGGAGAVAWSVAQGPNAELASTGMSMMLVMMVKLMYSRGLVAIPGAGGGDDFAATRGVITQVSGEYKRWLAGSSMLAMAALSIGYAVAFLILRAAVGAAFGIFQNLYVAGGAAAMIGAVVVFPTLLPSILSSLKNRGVVTTPSVAPAPVQQMPAPAPVVQQQPAAPRPQAPVSAPADAPIMMRRKKKEA